MQFIIKFFPEITIKSKPVRKQMVKRLRDNLFAVLRPLDGKVTITNDWDKLVVELSPEGEALKDEFIEVLSNSGGIAYFLEVETHNFSDLDDIALKTLDFYQSLLPEKTFVVRCKRSGKHEFTSHDIERYVGGYILKQGIAKGVDLHTPDVTVSH